MVCSYVTQWWPSTAIQVDISPPKAFSLSESKLNPCGESCFSCGHFLSLLVVVLVVELYSIVKILLFLVGVVAGKGVWSFQPGYTYSSRVGISERSIRRRMVGWWSYFF